MIKQKLAELLPCPFHKSSTMVDLTDNGYGRWFVGCGGCGSSSGHCKTEEQAIALWNDDRAPTAKELELQAEVKRLRRGLESIIHTGDKVSMIKSAKKALEKGVDDE